MIDGESSVSMPAVYVALMHYPVFNRAGDVVATAVTNLDVHDIARASRTYGVAGYFVVTPIVLQQRLVREIAAHWTGSGGLQNTHRRAALALVRVAADLESVVEQVLQETKKRPLLVATAARASHDGVEGREWLTDHADVPVVLMFGTGWGLDDAVLAKADVRLAPIWGPTTYNHLSVRSAVAITLDRLLGIR